MGCRRVPFLLPCFALVCLESIAQQISPAATLSDRSDGPRLVALLESELADLTNLFCTRTVTRFYRAQPGGVLHRIDVIGAVGGYVNGRDEDASDAQWTATQPNHTGTGGSWSIGEFGAILAEESAAIASDRVALATSETKDAYVIRYHVPATDSAWDLQINGRHWRPGYEGILTVGKLSGHVVRVSRAADEISPSCPVERFVWQVEYEPRAINERPVSVPVRARYENCAKASGRCAVNEILFSDYREFRSVARITFGDVGALVSSQKDAATPTVPLPSQ